MAFSLSFCGSLTFVLTYCCSFVSAAPWIVTEYYQEVRVTPYGYGYYSSEFVTTSVEEVTPTVTSLPEAISTVTSIDSSYSADVTVIQKLYPSGIGEDISNVNYDDGYGYSAADGFHSTIYVVNLTFTAPTGCSSHWTTTTTATVDPPSAVKTLLPLTATTTSTSVDTRQAFQPTTYFYDIVWVDPTQVPSSSLGCLSDQSFPTALYEGPSCSYRGHGCYYYGSNGNYYNGVWQSDSPGWGVSPWAILIIIIVGWVGLFFLLGIVEAWFRFRRLMNGWQTRRGFPLLWSFMLLPLSLFCLCCFRKGYRARNAPDAAFLQQKWRDLSPWKKLRLFFIWGFRFKYPDVLGPAPARVKASKRPGKDASGPLLHPQIHSQSHPMAHGASEASGALSGERERSYPVPEMGETSSQPPHPPAQVQSPAAVQAQPERQNEEIGLAH